MPEWNKGALTELFDNRYLHVREFGNVNYKIKGMENVRLADADAGIAILQRWLLDRPAILLCMCPTVGKCHRSIVAELAAERLGVDVHHITTREISSFITTGAPPEPPPEQLSLL